MAGIGMQASVMPTAGPSGTTATADSPADYRGSTMSIDRLKGDLRLTLILMFGVLTITGITPFVIYRFASGQWAAGLLDIAIQAGIGAAVLYAWRGGDVDRAGLLVAAPTGVMLFMTDATQVAANPAFRLKLVLIAAAVLNAAAFHRCVWFGTPR